MRREWGMCGCEFLIHMRDELARIGTGNEGSEGDFAFHSISFWPPLCVCIFKEIFSGSNLFTEWVFCLMV